MSPVEKELPTKPIGAEHNPCVKVSSDKSLFFEPF